MAQPCSHLRPREGFAVGRSPCGQWGAMRQKSKRFSSFTQLATLSANAGSGSRLQHYRSHINTTHEAALHLPIMKPQCSRLFPNRPLRSRPFKQVGDGYCRTDVGPAQPDSRTHGMLTSAPDLIWTPPARSKRTPHNLHPVMVRKLPQYATEIDCTPPVGI